LDGLYRKLNPRLNIGVEGLHRLELKEDTLGQHIRSGWSEDLITILTSLRTLLDSDTFLNVV
jgi:hypothetical protein